MDLQEQDDFYDSCHYGIYSSQLIAHLVARVYSQAGAGVACIPHAHVSLPVCLLTNICCQQLGDKAPGLFSIGKE